MGEMAEMAMENEWALYHDALVVKVRKQDFAVWRCKDGRVVKVVDMDDNHLANTIAMLKRVDPLLYSERIAYMEKEVKRRKSRNQSR